MTSEQWRISVDQRSCVGTGLCVDAAPQCFAFDAGRAHVTAELVEADQELIDIAESCPTESVSIRRSGSGDQVYP